MTDVSPIVLILLYVAVLCVFCAFWFIAVPVYTLVYVSTWLSKSMASVWRIFLWFDALLSRKLNELWREFT